VSEDGPWKAIGDVPQLAKLLKPVDNLDDFLSEQTSDSNDEYRRHVVSHAEDQRTQ
jgi:hypothetical protein